MIREQHAHILGEPLVHRIAQLHVVGKHDLAGGLGKADIARCRNGVGALVVGDRIGEQYLAVLRDFDVPAGNRQREILVVLDLVGADSDRGIRICFPPRVTASWASGRNCRDRQGKTAKQRVGESLPRGRVGEEPVAIEAAAPSHQPSSKWSSIEAPKIRLIPVGVQAASTTGTFYRDSEGEDDVRQDV